MSSPPFLAQLRPPTTPSACSRPHSPPRPSSPRLPSPCPTIKLANRRFGRSYLAGKEQLSLFSPEEHLFQGWFYSCASLELLGQGNPFSTPWALNAVRRIGLKEDNNFVLDWIMDNIPYREVVTTNTIIIPTKESQSFAYPLCFACILQRETESGKIGLVTHGKVCGAGGGRMIKVCP